MAEEKKEKVEQTKSADSKEGCGKRCEVFSRVVGYHRPVQNWNLGKKEEFKDRSEFKECKSVGSEFGKLGKPSAMAQKITNY